MLPGILEGKQLHTLRTTISVNVIPVPTPKKVGGRREEEEGEGVKFYLSRFLKLIEGGCCKGSEEEERGKNHRNRRRPSRKLFPRSPLF